MGTYDTQGGGAAHNPMFDEDPPLSARQMSQMLVQMINNDRSMGDQIYVRDIEYDGLLTFRLKLDTGEIFSINVSMG